MVLILPFSLPFCRNLGLWRWAPRLEFSLTASLFLLALNLLNKSQSGSVPGAQVKLWREFFISLEHEKGDAPAKQQSEASAQGEAD